MSRSQTLRALVNERLAAAAEEIFVLFERAIAEYEEELSRSKEENQRKQPVLSPRMEFIRATVQVPSASPGPGLNQDITETLWIKEEPEEQSVKQEEEQLPVPVPGSSAACVKDEESSLLPQRQTEHREETQGEDISSETHFHSETEGQTEHSSDTDNDDWEPHSSSAQMETEADGDHDSQVQMRDGSTKLSPQNKSAPETSVHSGHTTRADRGAERKKHQCPFCQKIFGTRQTLHTHIRVHTGERPYSCSIWLKRSPPGPSLNKEITETPWIKEEPEEPSVKQEEEQLPVPVPESSSVCVMIEESSLLQQRQTEHREETQGEDISSETHFHGGHADIWSDTGNDDDWEPSGSAAAQMETEADGDHDNQVQIRDRSTKSEATVHRGHMSGADGEAERKKHQCHVCGKRFERKQALQTHIRVHTGERPYSCSICTKTFNQKGHLNIHTRIHTGEKPYSCTVCNEHFADYSVFKRHRLMHTGERPYSCLVCETTFARKSSLDLHARTHTGERPYSCTVCGKTFARKDHLNAHLSTHRI